MIYEVHSRLGEFEYAVLQKIAYIECHHTWLQRVMSLPIDEFEFVQDMMIAWITKVSQVHYPDYPRIPLFITDSIVPYLERKALDWYCIRYDALLDIHVPVDAMDAIRHGSHFTASERECEAAADILTQMDEELIVPFWTIMDMNPNEAEMLSDWYMDKNEELIEKNRKAAVGRTLRDNKNEEQR